MSLARLLLERIVLGAVAIWAVLSLLFGLFTVTGDWALDRMLAVAGYGGADPEELAEMRAEFLAERGLDRPLSEQYIDWIGNMVTLQWGSSWQSGEAVFPMVVEATWRTAAYVVPSMVLATAIGLAIGLYAASNARSLRGEGVTATVYSLFGVPNFWIGFLLLTAASTATVGFQWRREFNFIGETQLPFVYEYVLPVVLVTTTLAAAVVSYTRAYALQYYSADLTKLVRAKGGGQRDVSRHVLRNAAIPLVSLIFAETLALLAISVIVIEAVFGIPGLGSLFYNSVWSRDMPVILGATVVIVGFGVFGNIVQDLAYSWLDPRVDTGSR
ncbi:ABC transporter permease [Natrialbaceae archaeon A-chndr2]